MGNKKNKITKEGGTKTEFLVLQQGINKNQQRKTKEKKKEREIKESTPSRTFRRMFAVLSVQPKPSSHKTPLSVQTSVLSSASVRPFERSFLVAG